MKFQKIINMTNRNICKIRDGKLKLQCGQWVRFDGDTLSSRFIGVTGAKVIWITHSEPNKPMSMSKFRLMLDLVKYFLPGGILG